MKTLTTLALVLATATSAAADTGAADANLPKEVQQMYCMVGDWTAKDAVFTVEGKKHKASFAVSCAPTSAGMGLLCSATFDIDGIGKGLQETDLFGYDPGSDRYHWFSVTQSGETHDHVALPPKSKDDPIVFAYSGVQDGKPVQEVVTMKFASETKIEFRNDGILGGKAAWLITATMTKKK
jgi:hypothetical protein